MWVQALNVIPRHDLRVQPHFFGCFRDAISIHDVDVTSMKLMYSGLLDTDNACAYLENVGFAASQAIDIAINIPYDRRRRAPWEWIEILTPTKCVIHPGKIPLVYFLFLIDA